MGLAAGQARLLTITGRKSDCEFESMRISHQKIALTRELAALSNEYQNSLDQTKLVYDFYGTGDTSMDLTYGILMSPSALNNYKPILVTDSMNRVVLNSQYAAAAEAAGIPREGLTTLPSETMRNNFIAALANRYINPDYDPSDPTQPLLKTFVPSKVMPEIISEYMCTSIIGDLANGIVGIPYNQKAGFGGDTDISVITRDVSLTELCDYIKEIGEEVNLGNACAADTDHIEGYYVSQMADSAGFYNYEDNSIINIKKGANGSMASMNNATMQVGTKTYTIGDIITDYLETGNDYVLTVEGEDEHNNVTGRNGIYEYLCGLNMWDQMFDLFEDIFNDGTAATEMALLATREKIGEMLTNPSVGLQYYDTWDVGADDAHVSDMKGIASSSWNNIWPFENSVREAPDGMNDFDNTGAYIASRGDDWYDSEVCDALRGMTQYLGICVVENNDNYGSHDDDSDMSGGSINISRMIMAYLTEFYIQMNGTSAGDYFVERGDMEKNKFIGADNMFTIVDREVSSDMQNYAAFYDTIFNMICKNGWCENDNVNDAEYLQHMLQNGMMYITKQKDDNFYYQGNYATDPYIKEVADEKLIAKAEAKYNTEKAKLNMKEETLDMKMKNLDTEISSLTTEYDTVKNTISKQIEKSFKRYNA